MKKLKTFTQIAYEAGLQNFGPWRRVPDAVRAIHGKMAEAVILALADRIARSREICEEAK